MFLGEIQEQHNIINGFVGPFSPFQVNVFSLSLNVCHVVSAGEPLNSGRVRGLVSELRLSVAGVSAFLVNDTVLGGDQTWLKKLRITCVFEKNMLLKLFSDSKISKIVSGIPVSNSFP